MASDPVAVLDRCKAEVTRLYPLMYAYTEFNESLRYVMHLKHFDDGAVLKLESRIKELVRVVSEVAALVEGEN